eukprot:4889448-Prymnesium_polylepis.1
MPEVKGELPISSREEEVPRHPAHNVVQQPTSNVFACDSAVVTDLLALLPCRRDEHAGNIKP